MVRGNGTGEWYGDAASLSLDCCCNMRNITGYNSDGTVWDYATTSATSVGSRSRGRVWAGSLSWRGLKAVLGCGSLAALRGRALPLKTAGEK
jgi:hypothetical protein